jgi:hypothetical protein
MRSWRKAGNAGVQVAERTVHVECYAGYKGAERPVRLQINEQLVDIVQVEDRWYLPGATYFRVLLVNGERYVLRREDAQDVWTLEAFRSPG